MLTFASPFWVGIIYGFISGTVFGYAICCLMEVTSRADDEFNEDDS